MPSKFKKTIVLNFYDLEEQEFYEDKIDVIHKIALKKDLSLNSYSAIVKAALNHYAKFLSEKQD